MKETINDLLLHQSWADNQHWKAFERYKKALIEKNILERLYHIHMVQRAFYAAIKGITYQKPDREIIRGYHVHLKDYAIRNHELILRSFLNCTDDYLEKKVKIPWFDDPPLQISIRDTLIHMAYHSHYHRGQNATRLREIGGEPPLTDLIIWIHQKKPKPIWK